MTLNTERFVLLKTAMQSKIDNLISGLKVQRMASFILLSMILPMVYVPNTSTKVINDEIGSNNLKVSLSLETPITFASETSVSEIKPGESKIEREAREKAEADTKAANAAKAKAEAQAQASRNVAARENRVYSDPSNFDEIYARAGNQYGVDPSILKAIHTVETGASGSSGITNHTGSGATGPMQFMPSTWRNSGADGNGDGIKDINNVEDAIFAAAGYLKACGYPNVQKALWGYNPSTNYYNKVIGLARSFGYKG